MHRARSGPTPLHEYHVFPPTTLAGMRARAPAGFSYLWCRRRRLSGARFVVVEREGRICRKILASVGYAVGRADPLSLLLLAFLPYASERG